MKRKAFKKNMHGLWKSTRKDLDKVLRDGALLVKQGETYIHGLWRSTRKDLDKALKDGSLLIKQGEKYIKDKSEKGKEKLETMALALQREKLYYDLGKSLVSLSKKKWTKSKKIENSLIKIRNISREIKKEK